MNTPLRAIAGMAAVVLVAIVVFNVLGGSAGGGVGGPVATPSPSPSTAQTLKPGNPAFACDDGAYLCAGALEAGDHTSLNADVSVAFHVPAGWRNGVDQGSTFILSSPGTGVDATSGGWIDVFVGPRAVIQDPSCADERDPAVGLGVDELVGWLRAHPALVTTTPTAVSIGGAHATMLDAALAPTWTKTCPGSTGSPEARLLSDPSWGIGGAGKVRLYALDVDSRTVVVIIESSDKADFDDLVAQATPIVQSMRITR